MLDTMIGSDEGFQEKQIRWTGQILTEQFGHTAQNPWKTGVTPVIEKKRHFFYKEDTFISYITFIGQFSKGMTL